FDAFCHHLHYTIVLVQCSAALRVLHLSLHDALPISGERELPSSFVGQLVMDELRQLAEVAYVRFASVYRSFQDVEEFRREIERLDRKSTRLNSSHVKISYAVFCLKKKKKNSADIRSL